MKFCIITPTSGLEKFATLSTTHLVLAHITDPDYMRFYVRRREKGDILILDNGAHELGSSAKWDSLLYALRWYNPQIAVLPDTLNDPQQTASDSLRFLDKYADSFPGTEWMYVVQAKGEHSLHFALLKLVLEDPRVGRFIKRLGITRYLTIGNNWNRAKVKHLLQEFHLPCHALGMVKGDLKELRDLEDAGFDSVDSSVPVWRGWNSFEVGQPGWPEIPVDFSTALQPTSDQTEQIYKNLRLCLEAAGADTSKLR